MNNICSISFPKRIFAGPGVIDSIAEKAAYLGAKRIGIVSDRGMDALGIPAKIEKLLCGAGFACLLCCEISGEPTTDECEKIYSALSSFGADTLIGIGGGSAIDVAKACGAMMTNGGDIFPLFGINNIKNQSIPTILIPTTSGTGTESTNAGVFINSKTGEKATMFSPCIMASVVLLDPCLTVSLPAKFTAYTGMDAFAHAIECFVGKKANELSDFYALKSADLIFNNIRRAYNTPKDIDARFNMQLGAMYAGMAISASGTTAVHALAYPLGARFHVAHGLSNAVLLPYVFDFGRDQMIERLCILGENMKIARGDLQDGEYSKLIISEFYSLNRDLDIPDDLSVFGVKADDLSAMADEATSIKRLIENNPKPVTKDDALAIYRRLMK